MRLKAGEIVKKAVATGPGGHRARMRQRIRMAGAQSLADYELLEVLLFAAVPRRDTKPQAKALLAHFGSLEAVLEATPAGLRAAGLGPRGVAVMACPALAARRLAHADLRGRVLLPDMPTVLDYCDRLPIHDSSGVRMLHLDAAAHLLADEIVPMDTPAALCRAILARALDLHAVSLIAVRDTGASPPPAQADTADRRWARMLYIHARLMGLMVQDCLLRGAGTTVSLRAFMQD
ncbi:JAB domain-containing protein [Komagataeibacter sp. FNDCF1]|uniref:JAB domain-containing protein n=1 Tax=Komagataeibacter sp. FNDCF1 TaxID=2878681 RepID=UPI001E2A8431|nr:JAB domain-containing protein [Komagataeibacter sp. FNDCF1]MCE2566058.1 DNA repair protein RadC [Komagataeibacter sp. FNDCF1]